MANTIKDIKAREILDSRGNQTVEVELTTEGGVFIASVPSGASTGKYEAVELRDEDDRYMGKGVLQAVRNVNEEIAPKLIGMEVSNQVEVDQFLIDLDGTHNKAVLGANAILSVSMAVCRAAASEKNIPLYKYIKELSKDFTKDNLPHPSFNIINGGAHAGNALDIQEFMIIPQENLFFENLRIASEVYHNLKKILLEKHGKDSINVGDEGGFAPALNSAKESLDLIMLAIEKAGYTGKVKLALDCAASEFYKEGKYMYEGKEMTGKELIEVYQALVEEYPLISIEDPFDQDDLESWTEMTKVLGDKISIIGDDLLVTNIEKIKQAKELKACNGLLLKINQIGTVSESLEAARMAREAGWKIMVSHRSGETTDSFIADLSAGIGSEFIKSGAATRGERVVKYNRLMKIEDEIKG
jgi:enolase